MQRYIKIIFLLLFFFIAVGCYLSFYFNKEEVNYLDTIDATSVVGDNIYAVGRNNNNDKELVKAKFMIYNNKQEKIYEKVYNTGYTSRFYDLVVDTDENSIIVGGYENSKKDSERKNTTAVILKYSSDGQILFEKNVSHTIFYDVLTVDDGYVVVGVENNKKTSRGVLVKYQKDGVLEWKKEYDLHSKFTNAVFFDEYIYVVGIMDNQGFLMKCSKDGSTVDTVTNNEIDSLGFSSITVVENSLVLAGAKKVTDDFSVPILVKYKLNLDYVDSVFYETDYSGRFLKVITDHNNDLIVIGSTAEEKKKKTIHHTYIGKYRSDLREASVVPYYNEEDDYFTDVSFMNDNYLVSGYSFYPEQGYLSKFLLYSKALKVLEVK